MSSALPFAIAVGAHPWTTCDILCCLPRPAAGPPCIQLIHCGVAAFPAAAPSLLACLLATSSNITATDSCLSMPRVIVFFQSAKAFMAAFCGSAARSCMGCGCSYHRIFHHVSFLLISSLVFLASASHSAVFLQAREIDVARPLEVSRFPKTGFQAKRVPSDLP